MEKHAAKSLVEMECVPMGVFYLGANSAWEIKPHYVGFIEY